MGTDVLTPEIDIYAFAICCVEILTKGALPWPLMDDEAVRRFVLGASWPSLLDLYVNYLLQSITSVLPSQIHP